ncbi:MAG: T9SS type A sorting domain-containing protein, partial [Candidatus Krumholzibacteriota bacterium]|nr:T9SS type A sorting domain-containing protein [Candidatus Krumholzibacteriota bacterium]
LHSGGIDSGDPGLNDPDESCSNQGLYGGPGAATSAPAYVQGFSATALNDTTIKLTWDPREMGNYDYYAIYCDTADGFIPQETNYLDMVSYPALSYQHHPVSGCFNYRVCLVNTAGYAGGYSVQDSACAGGGTTGFQETPSFANRLEQNYPNPFNGHTTISYSVSGNSLVELRIYDTAGRLVRTLERKNRNAGRYQIVWDGKDNASRGVASGVYFMRISTGEFEQSRKLVYLR